ncbi:MAG: T9SS type A sorting domain-containing protein [Bacteroidetes bacterium]|nr:T9SS type A sorting domain-containing protein [Bacteroidota bacterium]
MKKYLKVIALSFSIFFFGIVNGQDLGVDTLGSGLNIYPDTLALNDNYTHQVTIMSYGGASFTGYIYLIAGIDTNGTLFSVDTVGTVSVSNFGFGDTVSIFYNETYSVPNGYKTGDNIVVVWPYTFSGTTRDTLRKNIYIDDPISVNPITGLDDELLIYPNPFHDKVFIKNLNNNKTIDQVRIIDVNGKIIYDNKFSNTIKFDEINTGIYFLEIFFENKKSKRFRLIKN